MQLFIDSDALATPIKNLIINTAIRRKISAVFVANQPIRLPACNYLTCVVVAHGFDKADDYISEHITADDLVVSNDIALAHQAITKQAQALDMQGNIYSADTIAQKLAMRDFMDTMRGSGILKSQDQPKHKPFDEKSKKRFADALNRLLDKQTKASQRNLSNQKYTI